ncbi:hypothetical protein Q3G72_031737 [Acer saccharum]|nr:hypothetical protein Q3G72_031737 [Acer saccharum]
MNPEELEMLCGALSIREKERPVGTLATNLIERGERLLSLCLVGKVLTTKRINKEAFINVMTSIWRVNEGVEIEALEGNVFAFHFKNLEDRKYIQAGGPWTFDRAITVFEEPSGTGDIALMKFNKVEFWVQIHNLTLMCVTEDTGDKTLGVNLSALKGKAVQSQEAVDEREKKGTMPCSSMGQIEMDQVVLIGPIVLPSPEGNMNMAHITSLGSSDPSHISKTNEDISMTFSTQSTKSPGPNKSSKKTHSSVKWKRAARCAGSNATLGILPQLGKKADQIREEGIQSEGKKGKFSEVVNQSSDAAKAVIPDDLAQSQVEVINEVP